MTRAASIVFLLLWSGIGMTRTFDPYVTANQAQYPEYWKLRPAVQILLNGNPGGLETLAIDRDQYDQFEAIQNRMTVSVSEILIDRLEKKDTRSRTEDRLNQLVDQTLASFQQQFDAEDAATWMQGFRQACWRLNDHDWLAERHGFEITSDQKKTLRDNARRNHGAYETAFSILVELVGEPKAIELIGAERSGQFKRPAMTVPDGFDPKQLVADWIKMLADVERTKTEVFQNASYKRRYAILIPMIDAKAGRDRMRTLARMTGTELPHCAGETFFVGKVESILDGDRFVVSTRGYVTSRPSMMLHNGEPSNGVDAWFSGDQEDFRNLDQGYADRHIPPREIVVNLAGIDAPEIDQPYGIQARDALRSLCEGKFVVCNTNGCGEPLILAKQIEARVYTKRRLPGSVVLQTSLLDSGMAWKITPRAQMIVPSCANRDFGEAKNRVGTRKMPRDHEFQTHVALRGHMGGMRGEKMPDANVVRNNVGLWADADPIAPWNWRAEHRLVPGLGKRPDQIRYLVSEQLPKPQFELLAEKLADKLKLENAVVSFYTSRPLVTMTWTDAVDRTTKHHVAKAVFRDGALVELAARSRR